MSNHNIVFPKGYTQNHDYTIEFDTAPIWPSPSDITEPQMGCYIDPKDMTKEEWIAKHGVLLTSFYKWNPDKMPVCLVDNGPFKALAITYNEAELKEFLRPDDKRKKIWYLVDVEHLKPYLPEHMRPEWAHPMRVSRPPPWRSGVTREFVQELHMEVLQSATQTYLSRLAARFELELTKQEFMKGIYLIPGELTKQLASVVLGTLQTNPANFREQVEVTYEVQAGITIHGERNPEGNSIRLRVVVKQ